jgi:hypothetical protein
MDVVSRVDVDECDEGAVGAQIVLVSTVFWAATISSDRTEVVKFEVVDKIGGVVLVLVLTKVEAAQKTSLFFSRATDATRERDTCTTATHGCVGCRGREGDLSTMGSRSLVPRSSNWSVMHVEPTGDEATGRGGGVLLARPARVVSTACCGVSLASSNSDEFDG